MLHTQRGCLNSSNHYSLKMSIKLELSQPILEKFSFKCNEIPSSGRQVVPRERTDRHDQAIRCYSQFCKQVSKNLQHFKTGVFQVMRFCNWKMACEERERMLPKNIHTMYQSMKCCNLDNIPHYKFSQLWLPQNLYQKILRPGEVWVEMSIWKN